MFAGAYQLLVRLRIFCCGNGQPMAAPAIILQSYIFLAAAQGLSLFRNGITAALLCTITMLRKRNVGQFAQCNLLQRQAALSYCADTSGAGAANLTHFHGKKLPEGMYPFVKDIAPEFAKIW